MCALNVYVLQQPLKFFVIILQILSSREIINITSCCGHLDSECCCEVRVSVYTGKKFKS